MYNSTMKQSLEIIQNQKQKFSSKLVPSMEILALSQHELESLVDASLMDNPFSDVDQNTISLKTRDVDLDFKRVRKKQGELQEIAYADESQDDLFEHVIVQLYPHMQTKKDEEVFTVLLESLDSRGFLSETPDDLCRFLNIKKARLLQYLHVLQHVDPKGLGAKDTGECICIQLSEIEGSTLAQHIVCSHLEALSTGDFLKIAKSEHTDVEHVKQALSLIRSLNPIPANGFRVREKTVFIIPDVYIRLQYSISRRSVTLKKIIAFLVEYQAAFFQTGDECALKPLRLVDIAEQLKMHTSTISRAISGKFFQCEYGTYSFHFLVPRCYERQGEVTASIDTIRNEIKEIIRSEDKQHPYSDEKIHQLLEEDGFVISRRSVTLYRKECGIPSSRNRKTIHI